MDVECLDSYTGGELPSGCWGLRFCLVTLRAVSAPWNRQNKARFDKFEDAISQTFSSQVKPGKTYFRLK